MGNITFKNYEKIIFEVLYNWLKEVESSNPKLDKIQGIYFGIYEPIIDNKSYFETYLVGMNNYDLYDENWINPYNQKDLNNFDEYSKKGITLVDLAHYDFKAEPENVTFNFGDNELNWHHFIYILALQILKLKNSFPNWKIFNIPNITYGFDSGDLVVLNNKDEIEKYYELCKKLQ